MKTKTALVVSIILAGNLISFATSHTPVGSESPQKTSTRKTKVDVRYNKKTDISTVQLEELIIWKNPIRFEQIGMTFGFDYPKRTIITPKLVTLRFLAATKDWDPFPVDDVDVMLEVLVSMWERWNFARGVALERETLLKLDDSPFHIRTFPVSQKRIESP